MQMISALAERTYLRYIFQFAEHQQSEFNSKIVYFLCKINWCPSFFMVTKTLSDPMSILINDKIKKNIDVVGVVFFILFCKQTSIRPI